MDFNSTFTVLAGSPVIIFCLFVGMKDFVGFYTVCFFCVMEANFEVSEIKSEGSSHKWETIDSFLRMAVHLDRV